MSHAVILKSLRSPIGKFQGAMAPLAAPDLAAQVVKALLAAVPGVQPTEAIFGNVVGAGVGQAPADVKLRSQLQNAEVAKQCDRLIAI